MAISDSHYYRIWHYSVLVYSSFAISASFVIKINPRLSWKITSASLLHSPVADMEMVACFQLFQIRKIRHMFIWSVSNTWLSVPPMRRFCSGGGRLVTSFCRDKRMFGPACQCVCCETSHQGGHLVSTSTRCTADNAHLIKSHYENPFFWSTGQSLRNED